MVKLTSETACVVHISTTKRARMLHVVACRSVGAAKAVGAARRRRQHEQCDAAGTQHRWRQREEALGDKRRSALPRPLRSIGWHCRGRVWKLLHTSAGLRNELRE